MSSDIRQPDSVPLWPDQVSGALTDQVDRDENGWYHNVSDSLAVPFLPPAYKANGTCLLICPGGAYRILDWVAHVERLAALFNPMGYAIIGLKYRTVSPDGDVPKAALEDLQQALRVLQTHAEAWRIDPHRIVGLGYSAGSNLLLNHACSTLSSADAGLSHMALLCLWPNDKTVDAYPVPSAVPNVFLCTTEEDQTGPASFSLAIADRMQNAGVNVTTRIYPIGNHRAFNFKDDGPEVDWTPSFLTWLKESRLD